MRSSIGRLAAGVDPGAGIGRDAASAPLGASVPFAASARTEAAVPGEATAPAEAWGRDPARVDFRAAGWAGSSSVSVHAVSIHSIGGVTSQSSELRTSSLKSFPSALPFARA